MPIKKRPGLIKRATAAVLSKVGGKKPVTPGKTSDAQTELIVGKKLSERMWIPNLALDSVDASSPELDAVRTKASSAFGECRLFVAKAMATSGTTKLVGIAKVQPPVLLGVYELSSELDGVLLKRVCDRPARDLLKAGVLSGDWPVKYEPPNGFGGNRKLPSRTSVKDILSTS